jgi:predicted component of type VI protein secretion system
MLAYNIWRYMKLMASSAQSSDQAQMKTLAANTIRIARLKLLFIAAKVVKDQNRDKVKFSIHDARTPAMFGLLARLDPLPSKSRPWAQNDKWPQRFAFEK